MLTPKGRRVAIAPFGFFLAFPEDSAADRVYQGDESLQVVVTRKGWPATYDDSEVEVSRWVALDGLPKRPECELTGTWLRDGKAVQGRVAHGDTLMLLTDRYLRCAIRSNDSNRVLVPDGSGWGRVNRGWRYAFLFDLEKVSVVSGGRKALAFGDHTCAMTVRSVNPAAADWDYPTHYKGCGDFAVAFMRAVLDSKARSVDETHRHAAATVAATDYESQLLSSWRPARFDFAAAQR